MDNLDLLIQKFKEAKDELQKTDGAENLDKALGIKVTTPTFKAPKTTTLVEEDQKRAKEMAINKGENLEKAPPLPRDARLHALADASRAGAQAVAPKVAVAPRGVADRGPARAQQDLNWLTGSGIHAVTGGPAPAGFTPGSSHAAVPNVPAGAGQSIPGFVRRPAAHAAPSVDVPAGYGRGIPGFERNEGISFSKNGQWSLDKMNDAGGSVNTIAKDEGTGVVAAPKNLSQVSDIAKPTRTMPKITPQPAEKVGLAHPSMGKTPIDTVDPTHIRSQSGTQLYGSSPVTPNHTVIRPQSGTQLYTMNQSPISTSQSPVERNAHIVSPHSAIHTGPQFDFGMHPNPFGAALAESNRSMAPSIAPVTKAEDLHDEKGRCYNCSSKSCDGTECKGDHEKAAVQANAEKNKGFKNKIKGAEKLSLNKGGQWSLKKAALEHCSRCKKKPCECIKTEGVLVER